MLALEPVAEMDERRIQDHLVIREIVGQCALGQFERIARLDISSLPLDML